MSILPDIYLMAEEVLGLRPCSGAEEAGLPLRLCSLRCETFSAICKVWMRRSCSAVKMCRPVSWEPMRFVRSGAQALAREMPQVKAWVISPGLAHCIKTVHSGETN